MDIIKSIEHEQLKNKIPELKVGNTVRVHVKIKEGNKERIQVFEGIIIKVQGGGVNQTFTVRKISYGVGVEKTFLVHSPLVEKVELVRVGKARRARLFYLRDRIGKAAKTKEQVGARIEDKEIVVKEELTEEPETSVEEPVANATEKPETSVEEPATSAPEEAPSVETENVTVQETVDTVKEEPVEDVKAEPAAEETKVEEVVEEKAETTEKVETEESKTEEPATTEEDKKEE